MPNFPKLRLLLGSLFLMLVVEIPLALGQDDAPEERILDEVVAKVNQTIFTLTDLQKETRLMQISLRTGNEGNDQQRFERARRGLLKGMIQSELLKQHADERGMLVDIDQRVDQALSEMLKSNNIPDLETFDQILQREGTTLAEYRSGMKDQYIQQMVLQQEVYSRITLLTSEIEDYYQKHQDQFTLPGEYELAEAIFLLEGKKDADVLAKAKEAYSKLDELGFEEMAKRYSDGPTAANGGRIPGSFKDGSLNEAIEKAISELKPGEVSGIFKSNLAYHIIKLISRTPPRVRPLEEVKKDVQNALYQEKSAPLLKTFVENLMQQSYIYVAPKYQSQFDLEGLNLAEN